jgi:hypothetical protein
MIAAVALRAPATLVHLSAVDLAGSRIGLRRRVFARTEDAA